MTSPLDGLPPEVTRALHEGRTLDAIKLLRQAKGVSLKSAAQHIESVKGHVVPRPAPAARPHGAPGATQATAVVVAVPQAPLYHEGLAPGEVPRSRESFWSWFAVVLLLGAFARWHGWF